jgi:hypothetical protein
MKPPPACLLTEEDAAIWEWVCRRSADGYHWIDIRACLVSQDADRRCYELMLRRAQHRDWSATVGYRELTVARFWSISDGLRLARDRLRHEIS